MNDLLMQLAHRDWKVREEAMQEIFRHGADSVPALCDALSNEEVRVRVAAVTVLGWLKDLRAVGPLADFAQEARATADERALAVKAVAEVAKPALRHAPGLLDFFLRFRKDADPAARAWAARGIARLGDATLLPYVEDARRDSDEWVRGMAATSLTLLTGAPSATQTDIAPLRSVAATLLASLTGAPRATQADPEQKMSAAVNVASLLPETEAVRAAITRLNSPDSAARAHAIAELSATGPSVIAALADASRSSLPQGRIAAVTTLTRLADRKTIPTLVALLNDSHADAEVRALAARGLSTLATESDLDLRAALIAAGRTSDRFIKAAAVAGLAPFHDADARAFLLLAADDPDTFVCDAAADALARSSDARDHALAAPIAELLLRTTDPKTRALLNQALRAIDGA